MHALFAILFLSAADSVLGTRRVIASLAIGASLGLLFLLIMFFAAQP